MNKLLRTIPFPVKLMLIGIIPLVFALYLSVDLHKEKTEKIKVLEGFITYLDQSVIITRLIDDLQLERRLSYGFIMRKQGEAQMVTLRGKANATITQIESLNASNLEKFKSYTFLDQLDAIRDKIDKGQATADEVMNYYTTVIFRLNML